VSGIIETVAEEAVATAAKPMLPWMILGGLLLLASLVGGAFYKGWEMRGDRDAALQAKAEKEWQSKVDAERERGEKLAAALEVEKQNIKTVTVEVVKEIPKYTKVYVERPGDAPKPIPPAVINWGAVGLYDRALRPDLPSTAGEFARPAGATDLTRSPADVADVLGADAENAGRYAECRAQLNALIDWHEHNKLERRP
jgi:hypothetical protein